MTAAGKLLVALGAGAICVDIYAVYRVIRSASYSRAQCVAQAALIICVPFVGAWVAIFMARDAVPMFQSRPVEHVSGIGPDSDTIDYHGD
jgi:zinc transporter ZupT